MNQDRKTKLIIVGIFVLTAVPGLVFLGAALRAGAMQKGGDKAHVEKTVPDAAVEKTKP